MNSDKPRRRYKAGYATVFALGLISGGLILTMLRPPADHSLCGLGASWAAADTALVAVADSARFEGSGITGTLLSRREGDLISVDLDIEAQAEATTLFEYEQIAFAGIESRSGTPFQMETDLSSLLIVHQGRTAFTVRFRALRPGAERMTMKIFSDGSLVTWRRIETVPPGGRSGP